MYDRTTGLPLKRLPQQRGIDYGVKELEGRLLFSRPVPSVWEDGSLVDGARLYGILSRSRSTTRRAEAWARSRRPAAGSNAAGRAADARGHRGGRSRGRQPLSAHRRRRGRAPGRGVASLELAARSEAAPAAPTRASTAASATTPVDTASVASGRAWKVAADLVPGEWRPTFKRLRLGGYVRRIESGSSTRTTPDRALRTSSRPAAPASTPAAGAS